MAVVMCPLGTIIELEPIVQGHLYG